MWCFSKPHFPVSLIIFHDTELLFSQRFHLFLLWIKQCIVVKIQSSSHTGHSDSGYIVPVAVSQTVLITSFIEAWNHTSLQTLLNLLNSKAFLLVRQKPTSHGSNSSADVFTHPPLQEQLRLFTQTTFSLGSGGKSLHIFITTQFSLSPARLFSEDREANTYTTVHRFEILSAPWDNIVYQQTKMKQFLKCKLTTHLS